MVDSMEQRTRYNKIKTIIYGAFFTLVYINVCNSFIMGFNSENSFDFFVGYTIVLFLLIELLIANYGIYIKALNRSHLKNNKDNRMELKDLKKLKKDFKIFIKGFKYCRLYLLFLSLIFLMFYIMGFLESQLNITKLDSSIGFTSILSIMFFCFVLIIKGICDEIVARRFLQNKIYYYSKNKSNKNILFSVIVSSLIFSLCHFAKLFYLPMDFIIKEVIIVFISGIYFGVIYGKSKSILLVGFLHGLLEIFLRVEEICYGYRVEKLVFNHNWEFLFILILLFVLLIINSIRKGKIKDFNNKFQSYLDNWYYN